MRQEAEIYAEEDEKRRLVVELKNQSETLFANCKETLKGNANLISNELKERVRKEAAALKQAVANPNIAYEDMKHRLESFQEMLYALGSAIYEQAGQSSSSASSVNIESSEFESSQEEMEFPEAREETEAVVATEAATNPDHGLSVFGNSNIEAASETHRVSDSDPGNPFTNKLN